MEPQEPPVAKKSYDSPKLTVFGEIEQLTQNVNQTGNLDTGSGRQKT